MHDKIKTKIHTVFKIFCLLLEIIVRPKQQQCQQQKWLIIKKKTKSFLLFENLHFSYKVFKEKVD